MGLAILEIHLEALAILEIHLEAPAILEAHLEDPAILEVCLKDLAAKLQALLAQVFQVMMSFVSIYPKISQTHKLI